MKKLKIKLIVIGIALTLLIVPGLVPAFSNSKEFNLKKTTLLREKNYELENLDRDEIYDLIEKYRNRIPGIEQKYDTIFIPREDLSLVEGENDLNYNVDAFYSIVRSLPIHVGEPIEEYIPGRGRTGSLDPDNGDDEDCFSFPVCIGQTISVSLSSSEDYEITIINIDNEDKGQNYVAEESNICFIKVYANEGANAADYNIEITLNNQNDAGTGKDAGDSITNPTEINAGTFEGYIDSTDPEDWYSFEAQNGDGFIINLDTPRACDMSDFDIHLYDPTDELVYEGTYYGEDEIEYKADMSGTWKIKIDTFPGWDESKWPDDYYLYGSGVYILTLTFDDSAQMPAVPKSQPEITPVAKTYIIQDDPDSNMDEYAYLAAVPAANYFEENKRFVSPIVYQGIDYVSTWATTVDETTQYLLDDWNTYLDGHGLIATEYNIVNNNPIQAAVDVATSKWSSSDKVVLTVDGSSFNDEIKTVFEKSNTLNTQTKVTTINSDDAQLNSENGYMFFIDNKWGAISVQAFNYVGPARSSGPPSSFLSNYYPTFISAGQDWWPTPYDGDGDATDHYYPVTSSGLWSAGTTLSPNEFTSYKIIQVPGDRYYVNIPKDDCSLKVTLTSDEATPLLAYLVDPDGNIRRPNVPHYNGGEITPIHYWNGGHWENNQDEFRALIPEISKVHTTEINYPMQGKWTIIVVPSSVEYADETYSYTVKAELRTHSIDRANAALSAANAAVIASQENAPLLYVTDSSIPTETSNVISQLGASNIIFVNINGVSSADVNSDIEYNSLQEVIDAIKSYEHSENYITITSLGSGDGYYAPSAMIAAYHTSPVLNFGEAKEAYNILDSIAAYREYEGDYYHGARSVGHLPQVTEPIELEHPIKLLQLILYYFQNDNSIPPLGLNLKLQWYSTVYNGIHDMIDSYGLDAEGKEAYMFVGSRDKDIRDPICRAMIGNESYSGLIPVDTTGFASDIICRNILYPAIIHSNPGKLVTTSQMMNYPDGYQWKANDGNEYPNYATQSIKESFSSYGRFFEGHCIWDNLLERYNKGTLLSYYSGHGTGGSGISAQFKNVEEQFPLAELRYEYLKDIDWWDSWRGYSGYDEKQTKTCRWGGESGYNAKEPNLYDIIHFKYVDELFENLHSEVEWWSSCTTGEHWGPFVYLSHGSVLWYGCAGSAYGVQDDLHNSWIFHDMLVEGKGIGESEAQYQWMFNSDYTTCDPTTLYGRSTLFQFSSGGGLTNCKVIFGDPEFQIYNPTWVEPEPINP